MLISTHKLSKTFGARPLFSGLTFTIEEGDRMGLIGPNGAGKSTLLKILAGQITEFEGELSKKQSLCIGYLEQNPQFTKDATIFSTMMEGASDPHDWEPQSLAHEYISKMGLTEFGEDAKIDTLSGGWKKRVALARELVKKPDLLLLDEPTNHMDIEGIAWLEEFLSKVRFAVVTITHDRLFLQRVSNRIVEIDPRHTGGLLSVQGDYTKYLEIREQLILSQENREIVLKNTLRRETEWLRQGAKARTTKQQARIKQAGELKEEVENLVQRNVNRTARLTFIGSEKLPKKLIEAKNLSKSFDHVIFENLNLTLAPGTRLGLLGENGVGKSTLIRTLLGLEAPTTGEVFKAEQLKVAYFDQNRENLNPNELLAKTLCPNGEHVEFNGSFVHIRSYLDRFLFTPQQFMMKVGDLSGGEQSRLLVARLMLQPANLLILDEPTNDLDIATLNVLEECLQDFPGAIILVTHDRYFLDQVSNQLLAFAPKSIAKRELIGFSNFSQWEKWQEQIRLEEKEALNPKGANKKKVVEKSKLTFTEKYELDHIQENILSLESQLKALQTKSHDSNIAPSELLTMTQEMAKLQSEIDQTYQRWQDLEAKQNLP